MRNVPHEKIHKLVLNRLSELRSEGIYRLAYDKIYEEIHNQLTILSETKDNLDREESSE